MNGKYFHRGVAGLATLLLALASLSLQAQNSFDGPSGEIPSGTSIQVRMVDNLSSEQAQMGDTFHATLDQPIVVGGRELYPKGADVLGRVTAVHPTGRLSEPGELDLVLSTVSSGTVAVSIQVQPLVIKGESHTKSNVTKIGGGAALGAVIGAIAGGGKGAAIGTVAGGAAGTGAAAATGKKPAIVESEAVLTFVTSSASLASAPPPSNPSSNDTSTTPTITASPSGAAATPSSAEGSDSTTPENDNPQLFTLRDRRTIRSCVSEHASDLPPSDLPASDVPEGATERPALPPGSDRQIRRGGNLPSEVLSHAQSLPLACEEQLPALPSDLERVVYGGRALLIDSKGKVLDLFYLDQNQ